MDQSNVLQQPRLLYTSAALALVIEFGIIAILAFAWKGYSIHPSIHDDSFIEIESFQLLKEAKLVSEKKIPPSLKQQKP
jgi:hypothetical protein